MGMFSFTNQSRKPTSWLAQGPIIQPNAAVGSTYVYYDSTFNQDPTNAYPSMTLQVGTVWFEQDQGGFGLMNGFQYVKLDATTAAGQLVTGGVGRVAATGDAVIAAGSDTTKVQLTTLTIAANAAVGELLYIQNGGTNPQLRVIKQHTGSSDTPARTFYVSLRDPNNTYNAPDADLLPYTPTNGTFCWILQPYNRRLSTAVLMPNGVALSATTYTTNPFSVVQVSGIAMVQAAAVAHTIGLPCTSDASSRATIQSTTYAINFGTSIISLIQATPSAGALTPYHVNFLGSI